MQQFRATVAYRQRLREREEAVAQAERLPPVNDVAVTPTEAPPGPYPQTPVPPQQKQAVTPASPQVMQASYTAPVVDDWQQRLSESIAALEAQLPKNPSTPDEMAGYARLRMLYAAAGRQRRREAHSRILARGSSSSWRRNSTD